MEVKRLIPVLLSFCLSVALSVAQEAPSANVNEQGNKSTSTESPSKSTQPPGSPGKQVESGQSSESSPAAQNSSSGQESISGCLNQSGTAYTLTDSQTGTVYKLTGDTSHLSGHVGHEMQLTGQAENRVNEDATGAPSGNSGRPPVFRVSTVKHIADQCGPGGATANGPSL